MSLIVHHLSYIVQGGGLGLAGVGDCLVDGRAEGHRGHEEGAFRQGVTMIVLKVLKQIRNLLLLAIMIYKSTAAKLIIGHDYSCMGKLL